MQLVTTSALNEMLLNSDERPRGAATAEPTRPTTTTTIIGGW